MLFCYRLTVSITMWAKRIPGNVKFVTGSIDTFKTKLKTLKKIRGLATAPSTLRPFPVINVQKETQSSDSKVTRDEAIEISRIAEEAHVKLENVCREGGGEKGAKRHVQMNKKVLVRDRISGILDPGTELTELGLTAGMGLEYGDVPSGGTVAGIGQISGIPVMLLCNDATVKGGTSYPITVTKSLRIQEIAAQNGLTCLYVVDSGGAFLPLQSEIFPDAKHGGRSFANQAIMSGQGIPQISIVAGLSTAGGAYTPTMAEEHIMVHKVGQVYLGGPPLVKAALGEEVSGEVLGGATMHCTVSGVADHFASTEQESFQIVKDVMASLNELPIENDNQKSDIEKPILPNEDLDYYASKTGDPILPLDRESILGVLGCLLDGSRFQEFKARYGDRLICGFGYIEGQLCGIVSNCSTVSTDTDQHGLLLKDAQKGSHFVQLCNARDIPMIFLQNSGNKSASMQDPVNEFGDSVALKERGKLARCIAVARIPKITINITGATGDDHYTLCGPSFGSKFYFAWPRAIVRKYDPVLNQIEPPVPKVFLPVFDCTLTTQS